MINRRQAHGAYKDNEDAMRARFPIVSAVLAGMASPASLYAEPQDYKAYAKPRPISEGFVTAGAYLKSSVVKFTGASKQAATSKPKRRF
jgi:hypothetical protein